MANVNLISARRAERVRMARIAKGMIGGLFGAGLLGLGSVGYMTARLIVENARTAAINEQLKDLRPVLEEIKSADRERLALQPKLQTLTEAQKTTNRWFGVMDGLKRAVPEQTWLTNLSVEGAVEGPRMLRINGMTVNQTRVGETMFRLTQQPDYYKQVDLRWTQTTRLEERDNVEFELAAHLNQPELDAKTGEANAPQTK